MSLGTELRKARLAAGLTQEKVALKADLDRSYLSELERDESSPTVFTLKRICRVIGIKAWEVLRADEKSDVRPSRR